MHLGARHIDRKARSVSGFTMIEVFIVVAIIGVSALIAFQSFGNVLGASRSAKAGNDISALNSAVLSYLAGGGNVDGLDAPDLIEKLKTRRSSESANEFVGVTGSFLDSRVRLVPVIDSEPGFYWNASKLKFEESGSSQRYAVSLDEAPQVVATATPDARADSVVKYGDSGWIWEYDDAPKNTYSAPSAVTLAPPGSVQDDPVYASLPGVAEAEDEDSDVVGAPDTYVVEGGGDLVIDDSDGVLANDYELAGDVLAVTNYMARTAKGGRVAMRTSGAIIYSPPVGFSGQDYFTYTASNDAGDQSTQLVTVGVESNDDPVMQEGTDVIREASNSQAVSFIDGDVSSLSSDSDGQTLSYSAAGRGAYGTLELNNDGTYRYSLNNANPMVDAMDDGESLNETFNVTVDDGNGGTAQNTLTIDILGANDDIVTGPDAATIPANQVVHLSNNPWSNSGGRAAGTAGENSISVSATNGSGTVSFRETASFNSGVSAPGNTGFWSRSGITLDESLELVVNWDATPGIVSEQASLDAGTAQITFTFGTPVVNPILHIDRLGGNGTDAEGVNPYFSNSSEWTLITAGASLSRLSGNRQFQVSGNRFFRTPNTNLGMLNPGGEADNSYGSAAGSIQVNGAVSSLTFSVTGVGVEGLAQDGLELLFELPSISHRPATVDVVSNDYDPDTDEDSITLVAVNPPERGTVTFDDTSITYDPGSGYTDLAPGQNGTETLTYTVENMNGERATGTVTFTIEGP